jgi:hypothetical protein
MADRDVGFTGDYGGCGCELRELSYVSKKSGQYVYIRKPTENSLVFYGCFFAVIQTGTIAAVGALC